MIMKELLNISLWQSTSIVLFGPPTTTRSQFLYRWGNWGSESCIVYRKLGKVRIPSPQSWPQLSCLFGSCVLPQLKRTSSPLCQQFWANWGLMSESDSKTHAAPWPHPGQLWEKVWLMTVWWRSWDSETKPLVQGHPACKDQGGGLEAPEAGPRVTTQSPHWGQSNLLIASREDNALSPCPGATRLASL